MSGAENFGFERDELADLVASGPALPYEVVQGSYEREVARLAALRAKWQEGRELAFCLAMDLLDPVSNLLGEQRLVQWIQDTALDFLHLHDVHGLGGSALRLRDSARRFLTLIELAQARALWRRERTEEYSERVKASLACVMPDAIVDAEVKKERGE